MELHYLIDSLKSLLPGSVNLVYYPGAILINTGKDYVCIKNRYETLREDGEIISITAEKLEEIEKNGYDTLMGKTVVLQPSAFNKIGKHLINEYNDFKYFE